MVEGTRCMEMNQSSRWRVYWIDPDMEQRVEKARGSQTWIRIPVRIAAYPIRLLAAFGMFASTSLVFGFTLSILWGVGTAFGIVRSPLVFTLGVLPLFAITSWIAVRVCLHFVHDLRSKVIHVDTACLAFGIPLGVVLAVIWLLHFVWGIPQW